MIPIIIIAIGVAIYWSNFGWTLVSEPSMVLLASVTFIIIGLVIALKTHWSGQSSF